MFCKNCGTQLPDDANFCYKCAQIVNSSHKVEPLPVAPTTSPRPQQVVVQQSSGIGAAFFTILFLAVLGGGGFLWYQNNKPHNYLDVNVTDKGISVTSDGLKTSTKQTPARRQVETAQTQSQVPTNVIGDNYTSIRCSIMNTGGKPVNIRQNCDVKNCDSDDTTISGSLPDNTEVFLIQGNDVQSSLSRTWRTINYNGGVYFVASTKLACEEGE